MIQSLRVQEAVEASLELNPHDAPGLDYGMSRYQAHTFANQIEEQHRVASLLEGASYAAINDPTLHRFQPLHQVAAKLLDCCKTPSFHFDQAKCEFHIHEFRCKSRLCQKCRVSRAMVLKKSMTSLVKEMNSPRFITLTPVSCDDPLKDQIKHLVHSFAKLRRTKIWQRKFVGGIYTIEVTYNRKREQWHPHIHILADGKYIEKQVLSDAWRQSSGGAYVVDIRMAHDRNKSVDYLTAYVTKTNDSHRYPDLMIPEWAIGIKGLRFVSTFGSLRGNELTEEEEEDEREHQHIGHLCQLAKGARDGDDRADELWEAVVSEAHKGALPSNEEAKERAIDRRLKLFRQLTLWIENFERPPPDPYAESQLEPTKKSYLPDTDPVLFSIRPASGAQ